MKAKVVISLCAVVGLAALSVAALASSAQTSDTENTVSASIGATDREISLKTINSTTTSEDETKKESGLQTRSKDWSAEESYMLAKIAMAEAEGEDTEGKALVMLVVLNRVWSDGFPDSIEEVIMEPGQFSPVSEGGRYYTTEPDEECWEALSMVMRGWDESQGATYFESEGKSTWHRDNLKFLFRHGNHYFYEEWEE